MNKLIIVGIIVGLVIAGVVFTYSSGIILGPTNNSVTPEETLPQTTGRNLSINLNEGLNLRTAP